MKRRDFLAACVAAGLSRADEVVRFADYESEFEIEAQSDHPRIRCFDWRGLRGPRVEAANFFVFHQTRTVENIESSDWRLDIGGFVSKPATLTYSELLRRPQVHLAAAIECSGNSAHPRLMNGLVSSAAWRGAALGPLLRDCGVLPAAREVVFFGMDSETERKWPARDRELKVPHARSLFVPDALDGGAVLATEMNGKPLSAEHGFPVRLVVPGWYGMTQIKWLRRIVVLDRRYEGRHMARNYHGIHQPPDSAAPATPLETSISRMRLKSVTALVTTREAGYRIYGAAWSGEAPVESVEVRIDDGPWRKAVIEPPGSRWEWLLWRIDWPDAAAGAHTIVSRAIDTAGGVQPTPEEWRRRFASSREDNSQWTRRIVLG